MHTWGQVIHGGHVIGECEYEATCGYVLTPIWPEGSFARGEWALRNGVVRRCACGKPPTEVIVWVEYATGHHWRVDACLTCQCITGRHSDLDDGNPDNDYVDGHPLGEAYETEWTKLCRG